jgi:hypothetical protein
MPEIQEFVSVREIQQPCTDSVQAGLRTSGQEISAYVGYWLLA